jgi:hypothetical protein
MLQSANFVDQTYESGLNGRKPLRVGQFQLDITRSRGVTVTGGVRCTTHQEILPKTIGARLLSWAVCLQSRGLRQGAFPGPNARTQLERKEHGKISIKKSRKLILNGHTRSIGRLTGRAGAIASHSGPLQAIFVPAREKCFTCVPILQVSCRL